MRNLLTLLFVIIGSPVLALTAEEDFTQRLGAIQSISADFEQTVRAGNRVIRQTSGSMALVRPGLFRWQTKTPFEQIVITNAQKIWIYDQDLKQILIRPQQLNSETNPAALLSGHGRKLTQYYRVEKTQSGQGVNYVLKTGYKALQFPYILLRFVNDKLVQMQFMDKLNQSADLRLSNVKMNRAIEPKLFAMPRPKGVDIIQGG